MSGRAPTPAEDAWRVYWEGLAVGLPTGRGRHVFLTIGPGVFYAQQIVEALRRARADAGDAQFALLFAAARVAFLRGKERAWFLAMAGLLWDLNARSVAGPNPMAHS